ncbi:MAG: lysylphosphatidylglycerol synthase transmembrane domain-containing protein [Bacteroidales bacterium]
MSSKFIQALKYLFFLTVGCVIFYFIYKDEDLGKIKEAFLNAKYIWIVLSLFAGLLSHISRTFRWKQVLGEMDYKVRTATCFHSVMIGYMVNLIIPRGGEVSRCVALAQVEKIPFLKLMGTVVAERLIDLVMMIVILFIALALNFGRIMQLINDNASLQHITNSILNNKIFIILFFLLIVMGFVFRKQILGKVVLDKIRMATKSFIEGFSAIGKLKNKWVFVAHSVFIWTMYYLMTYLVFFAFDFTANLSANSALVVFILGSLGVLFPSPGGIGTWHYMVILSLSIYGIGNIEASTFALVLHTTQNFMLLTVGLISLSVLYTRFNLKSLNLKTDNKKSGGDAILD